jgi:hypothetical protein
MDVDELLSRAWAAVERSKVPNALHEIAFKEAVDFLRDGTSAEQPTSERSTKQRKPATRQRRANGSSEAPKPRTTDEGTFWERLAQESGAPESELRDILQLVDGSKVHVTPPTRKLGGNLAEQARTVIALVAGARAIGLEEDPVNATAVREECERKRCYNAGNFATKHLGALDGFNAGSNRSEIVLTSKWVDDFATAVKTIHGDEDDDA